MISMIFGALLVSFAPIFIKFISLGDAQIGAYRTLIGGMIFLLLFPVNWKTFFKNCGNNIIYIFLAGFFLGGDFICWHYSIDKVGIGFSTLLVNTQVFYGPFWQKIFLKTAIPKSFWSSSIFAFIGLGLILLSPGVQSIAMTDVFICLFAGFCYSGFLFCIKQFKNNVQSIRAEVVFGLASLVTAIFLSLYALKFEKIIIPTSLVDWSLILSLAIIVHVGAWTLIMRSMVLLPLSMTGLLLLIQPIGSVVLGVVFFNESMNFIQWAGVLITIFSLYYSGRKESE